MANTSENAIYQKGPKMKEKTRPTLLNTHTLIHRDTHTHKFSSKCLHQSTILNYSEKKNMNLSQTFQKKKPNL